jgi:hypothetical protein
MIDRVDNKDVWRDDLLYGGSKTLFIKRYIERRRENFDEFVYASPRVGYGQIALSVVCNQLGCKSSIFIPRGELTEISKKCIELGSNIIQVPMGYLSNLHHKSKKYNEENLNSHLLPFGFDCDEIINDGIEIISKLYDWKEYDEVWSVISSGVLSRILQGVFTKSKIIGVRIGHQTTEEEQGRAELKLSPYKFEQPCKKKELPPFPSNLNYDSKGWKPFIEQSKSNSLFWNCGGN